MKPAEEEILLIFPTTDPFIRQEKIGVIQVAKKVAKELDVQVRIEAHGGRIWAENNNGDIIGNSTGATFVSNLPIRRKRRNHFGYLDNIKKTFKNTCGFDLLSDWKSKIHNVLLTK